MKINKFFIAFLIFFFILFFAILRYFSSRNSYDIRIQIGLDNLSISNIERNLVVDLKKELLKVKEVKEVVILTKRNSCNVYLRLKPFIVKNEAFLKIQTKIAFLSTNILKNAEIAFDYDFNIKYDTLFVLYGDLIDYRKLVSYCDDIESFILDSRLSNKILKLGKHKKATYVYFADSDLVNYDLSLNDIKNKILQNNILESSTLKVIDENSYPVNINALYRNSNDLSNIAVEFRDKLFSRKFGDVFEIIDNYKKPFDYTIAFNDKNALILAISTKNILLKQILNFKIKKYINSLKNEDLKYKILNSSNLSKITIQFPLNSNIEELQNSAKSIFYLLKKKNFDDILFFIGIDSPKISDNVKFFEKKEDKIIIIFNKAKYRKIEKNLKINSFDIVKNNIDINQNKTIIEYDIDDFLLNSYQVNKIDIINSIFALNEGIRCCQYYDDDKDAVDIILKNKNLNSRGYVYSKATKNLIPLEIFLSGKLQKTIK